MSLRNLERFIVLLASVLSLAVPAAAGDIPIPGKIAIIKDGVLAKLVAKPSTIFSVPAIGAQPIRRRTPRRFDSSTPGGAEFSSMR